MSARPRILYVGNSRLRQQVVQIVDKQAELRVADNVRPTATEENLLSAQAELDACVELGRQVARKIKTVQG